MWKLTLDDLRLTDEDAKEFLVLKDVLPEHLQYPTPKEVILRECEGHIGALRCAVDGIFYNYHLSTSNPTLAEVLHFYFSPKLLEALTRCYGSKHSLPTSPALQQFLIKCLVRDATPGTIAMQKLSQKDKSYLQRLTQAGIVTTDHSGFVTFTTPMSEGYYAQWLFPNRAASNPASLQVLARKVLSSMSASVLR